MLIDIPKNFTGTGKDTYLLSFDYAVTEEVKNILGTMMFSKLHTPYFGTVLYDYLFAPLSPGIISIIQKIIKEVITTNCKYVSNVSSTVNIQDDVLNIKLILTTPQSTIETNTRFYLKN